MQAAKDYQAKKAEAGYAGLTWRKEVGGRGLPPIYSVIFSQEEAKFQAPVAPFAIGLGMCIPTVIAFHRRRQDQALCRPGAARRGDLVPALLRAERRIGRRRPQDARRSRWR